MANNAGFDGIELTESHQGRGADLPDAPPSYEDIFPSHKTSAGNDNTSTETSTGSTSATTSAETAGAANATTSRTSGTQAANTTSPASSTRTQRSTSNRQTAEASATRQQPQESRIEYTYDYKEQFHCYCETFRCCPQNIPQNQPKICQLDKNGCHCHLFILGAALLFAVLFFPLYFTLSPCRGFKCSDGSCLSMDKRCDGTVQCGDYHESPWNDESGCRLGVNYMPEYAVGVIGNGATIPCKVDAGGRDMNWFYTSNGDSATIWNSEVGHRRPGYRVKKKEGSRDLKIETVSSTHAYHRFGVVFTHDFYRRYTQFIVTDDWGCTEVEQTVVEGETFILTVNVSFYGNDLPKLLWYGQSDDSTTLLPSFTEVSSAGELNVSSTIHTATARVWHNEMTFTAYMPSHFPLKSYSSPPSSYARSCDVHINVHYGVRNMYFSTSSQCTSSPASNAITSDTTTVYCCAHGNPQPSYTWNCTNNDITTSGEGPAMTLPTQYGGEISCVCDASNTVGGTSYNTSETLYFTLSAGCRVIGVSHLVVLIAAVFATMIS